MGGGIPGRHAEGIAEFISQKGKPEDANDIFDLENAKTEIRKLRALTHLIDIHDFDAYIRSKNVANQEKTNRDNMEQQTSEKALKSPPKPVPVVELLNKSINVNEIAKTVKVKLDNRFISLHEAFVKLDIKNSGFINRQEFLDACWYWGVVLEEGDFTLINNRAGVQPSSKNEGRIDYAAFIELMSKITHAEYIPDVDSQEKNIVNIDDTLRSRVLDSGLTMKQCFREFDRDNSGCIEREEMRKVLDGLNVIYNEDQFESLFTDYDYNSDGKFQYSEFVRMIQRK